MRSMNLGRKPVGINRPIILPFSMPVFSNVKISDMVITSPSMPCTSEMATTRREPSRIRSC